MVYANNGMFEYIGLRARMKQMISVSYEILCNKIAKGSLIIENEASLQMQFGVLLSQIGNLYVFSKEELFSVELEANKEIEATAKSVNGRARCDIYLTISNSHSSVSAAIEIKCFITKDNKPSKPTTANRFSVLMDIKNLEGYREKDETLLCYECVYTYKGNYHNPNSKSDIKLVGTLPQRSTFRKEPIEIKFGYIADWANYDNHHFLMVDLDNNVNHKMIF
mgnify:CR=1 FL=1